MIELYNLFFYANTCHICKAHGNKKVLKKCSRCKMISYCSKEHQKKHWLQHKDLCHILEEILIESNKSNIFEGMKNSSMKDWVKTKMNLILIVIVKLQRKLLPYEEEMFKFPRACAVCHETNSKLITDCLLCPTTSFCKEHKNDSNHSKICKMLALCYNLDIASTIFKRYPPNIISYHTEITYLPPSMKNFIDIYMNENKSLLLSSDLQMSRISEYLTRPLTLLYSIEKLEILQHSAIIIHIIGANMIELDGLEIWEILLHWLPFLSLLNIILIGPELSNQYKKLKFNICDSCNKKGRKLFFETHGILYEEYCNSNYFVKPDITIGYNLGINEYETKDSELHPWFQSIKNLQIQKCPFILTSYTAEEAQKDHRKVCNILNKKVTYLYCEKNQFSSLRPHRDYETEECFYQNQFIIIYQDLNK